MITVIALTILPLVLFMVLFFYLITNFGYCTAPIGFGLIGPTIVIGLFGAISLAFEVQYLEQAGLKIWLPDPAWERPEVDEWKFSKFFSRGPDLQLRKMWQLLSEPAYQAQPESKYLPYYLATLVVRLVASVGTLAMVGIAAPPHLRYECQPAWLERMASVVQQLL